MLKIHSCSRKHYVRCEEALIYSYYTSMYIISTKQNDLLLFGHLFQVCVEGTALPFQVDAVLFQNLSLPNTSKLLWNFTWLSFAVCDFTSGSPTREPVNTMCFPSYCFMGSENLGSGWQENTTC